MSQTKQPHTHSHNSTLLEKSILKHACHLYFLLNKLSVQNFMLTGDSGMFSSLFITLQENFAADQLLNKKIQSPTQQTMIQCMQMSFFMEYFSHITNSFTLCHSLTK